MASQEMPFGIERDHPVSSIEDKNDVRAGFFRLVGNKAYLAKNFSEALHSYNISIAYAASKNALSLAYANRSAVYLEIERYNECLQNIKLARENGYENVDKLKEREEKCKQLLLTQPGRIIEEENLTDFIKLSYPANEKIPWIVDCVEMKRTADFGRGIYAKKDLKAGDLISIEKLPLFIMHSYDQYRRCHNCSKVSTMNLIPCDKYASIMFCSVVCKQAFYQKEELAMLGILYDHVRVISEYSALCGGPRELKTFYEKNKPFNKTLFDYDWNDSEDASYKHNLLTCLLSLDSSVNLHQRNSAACLISCEVDDHIASQIFTSSKTDAYLLTNNSLIIGGTTLLLFASLINHSCYSNADTRFFSDKVVTIIKRPVKAGQQIFFEYPLFAEECNCQVCKGEIAVPPERNLREIDIFSRRIQPMDFRELKTELETMCDFINKQTQYGRDSDAVYNFPILMAAIERACRFPLYQA